MLPIQYKKKKVSNVISYFYIKVYLFNPTLFAAMLLCLNSLNFVNCLLVFVFYKNFYFFFNLKKKKKSNTYILFKQFLFINILSLVVSIVYFYEILYSLKLNVMCSVLLVIYVINFFKYFLYKYRGVFFFLLLLLIFVNFDTFLCNNIININCFFTISYIIIYYAYKKIFYSDFEIRKYLYPNISNYYNNFTICISIILALQYY